MENSGAESRNSSSVISSSEVAFPRGGATALTPLEVKEISNEVTSDVLFEASAGTNNKRSNGSKSEQVAKKMKKSQKKKSASSKDETEEEKSSVQIENFSYKNLIPETLVLAQISSINKMDLTLAVGDNLVGFVPLTSISDEIVQEIEDFENQQEEDSEEESDSEEGVTTIKHKPTLELPTLDGRFRVGQWLRAKVVKPSTDNSKNNKKRIQFTIEPEAVNSSIEQEDLMPGNLLQCSVKSVEDHGIIMNTGKSGLSGFVSNKELGEEADLVKIGSVLLMSIVSKPGSSRTITLRPAQSASKKSVVTSISSIDAIQPGMLVDALVSDVTKNGVVCKVFGLVDATFNLPHLNMYDLNALKHKYTIGNNVKARVIAVLLKAGTKRLILSQLPHIIALGDSNKAEALESFPIGHVFDEVEVKGSDPNYIYVSFGSSTLLGEVHNSKIGSDSTVESYTVGSKHKARVTGFNSVEGLLVLTLDPKQINVKYLSSGDVPIGEVVTGCEIVKVLPESGGIVLKIFGSIEAFVPREHMSDVRLVYPERKFKVGGKVRGRVLKKLGKTLQVTLRKSLVNAEDDEILTEFDNAKVGMKSPATVVKFVHNGALVAFFGNLSAYLPKNEISETFVNDASDYLKLGQTVNVKVLRIDEQAKRILVTLRQSTELSGAQKTAIADLIPGKSIVDATVVEKTNESVIVELSGNNLRGVIFTGHLSDGNYEQNRVQFKKLPVGSKVEALVLEKDMKARTAILTMKESLITEAKGYAEGIPAHFKDIQMDNRMLHGYVKSVTSMGLFVSFAGRLTGLVLAKYATDKAGEQLEKKFYKYQSVACRVVRIDTENKRFLLSLKERKGAEEGSDIPTINPVDKSKKFTNEYVPGVVTKAIIKSIRGTQLNLQLADNLQGRVDVTQCFNSWDEIKDKKQPLSQFHRGQEIEGTIIGYHDAKTHRFLPVTHRNNKNVILEFSLRSGSEILHLANVTAGSKWIAYVNNVADGYAWASISPSVKGRISFMELNDDVSVFDDLENNLPVGSAIQVVAKEVDTEHNSVILAGRSKVVSSFKDVKVGQRYPARVLKVKETFVLVELGSNVVASAYITDALNNYSDKLESVFHTNDFVTATVVEIDSDAEKIAVSLRTEDAKDKSINSIEDLTRGDIVHGFVKNVSNNGVYVALGRSVHALVRISDLSDAYLKEWKKYFKPYQPVVGKISACKEEGRILMTLKESEVNGELNILKKFEDLEVGEIFEGTVRRATDFGVFVKLDGTVNISGLCHHSEIADNKVENVTALFGEGDRVKVKVLAVDNEKKQLSLGMKASYFSESQEDNDESEDVEMEDAEDVEDEEDSEGENEEAEDEDEDDIMVDVEDHDSSDSDSEDDESSETEGTKMEGLSTNGFDWTASILDQAEDSSESEDEDFTQEKKKKKRSKTHTDDKTAELNTRAPQSVSDFERLLIGSPNSSIMWMNYMSFQLQLSEIEKAREIGERALKTINYREEQEKMNIWIALLNLENTFGTEETLEDVFKRSCQYMESLTMHQKLVGIYSMSEKFDKADALYKTMTKKFGKHISVWVQYGSSLLDRHLNAEAREVLAKALQILPKKEHIEVVRKFAQLEFSKGDPEQGRSLFEGLVSDAPKRIDLWNVYIDQETKQGDKKKVEDLFERVITKKLSRKQAKFFFSKWLAFEEERGSEQECARVKAKAAEYVQKHGKDE
ncbi:rRNA biogenesis protein Rrp5p [[Candida] anglica]|uniref:rRNA biogenesis protein Rrp5p n=1 Tax=[Candida] anglica TaxID=148631 RepID=A0ABP0EEK7_9ASCO